MSLLSDLKQKPSSLSPASKFISISGIILIFVGLLFLIWPGITQTVYKDAPFAGNEQTLCRLIGLSLTVIGLLYYLGGKTGSRYFAAASVFVRIFLPSPVLIPIAISGVLPHTLVNIVIFDLILGLITWYLLTKSKK